MFRKLQESKKIKKEIKTFQDCIHLLDEGPTKDKAKNLLTQLLRHMNIINESHNPLTNHSIDPRKVRENIENSVNLRIQLRKILNDFKSR